MVASFTAVSPAPSLKENRGMRESVPRQVDKKSGSPRRREGSGILKEEERTYVFFFSYIP